MTVEEQLRFILEASKAELAKLHGSHFPSDTATREVERKTRADLQFDLLLRMFQDVTHEPNYLAAHGVV